MTLPTTPTDGQIAVEPTTSRPFIYSAAENAWSPYPKTDLFELEDIDPTPPSDPLHKLLWDSSINKYKPISTKNSQYVEAITFRDGVQAPTSSNVEEPGTMWSCYESLVGEETYVAAYTNPSQTETVWNKIGGEEGGWDRPAFPVQGTAPTSPVLGSLWFDNSGGPIVKKYWDGAAWQTLL